MLRYLDALIAALSMRDRAETERLLAHPLARLLSEDVIAEASALGTGERDALAAPLRAMQLRFQTAELLRDAPLADQAEVREAALEPTRAVSALTACTRRPNRQYQIELPLLSA